MQDLLLKRVTVAVWRFSTAALAAAFLAACAATGQLPPNGGTGPEHDKPASEAAETEAASHARVAESLLELGNYEAALDELFQAAELSDDTQYVFLAARLAGLVEDWPASIRVAQRWLEIDPQADAAHQLDIIARVNLGQHDNATQALERWLDGHQPGAEDPEWWRLGAAVLSKSQNQAAAVSVFDLLAARRGGQAPAGEVLRTRSELLMSQHEIARALEDAIQAAEDSGHHQKQVWAGDLLAESGQPERALEFYSKAFEQLDENDTGLGLKTASVLAGLDRYDEALQLLRSLPPNSLTLYETGRYLTQMKERDGAIGVWREMNELPARQRDKNHLFLQAVLADLNGLDEEALRGYEQVDDPGTRPQARLRQARLLGRLDRLEEGRTVLQALREENPDNEPLLIDAWLVEAAMLKEGGHGQKAVDLLSRPLAQNHDSVELLMARSTLAMDIGNVDLAEQDLRRIIQMDSTSAVALNNLGYILADMTDRHQEAYRLIKRAYELEPNEAYILDSMGWALHKLGRNDEAAGFLQRVFDEARDDDGFNFAEAGAHYIAVLDELGRHAEADRLTEKMLAEYPRDAYLLGILEELGRLPE